MQSEPSDEELMAAYAKDGNAVAFSTLYKRFESKLYGFFMRRLGQDARSLAPDLFQRTWLKVHHARDQFDEKQKFSPWLFSIALNTLRDEWRGSKIVESFEDPADQDQALASDDTERSLSLKEDLNRLERVLEQIPTLQREALLLTEWEGFNSKELARALGVSEAAARQTVSRARRRVRQLMEEAVK